jgi:sulfite reductase (NADPH) flavoprotein alpha-component
VSALVNRNGLDIVREFPVRAAPEQWQEVLVRLTPRQFSISTRLGVGRFDLR